MPATKGEGQQLQQGPSRISYQVLGGLAALSCLVIVATPASGALLNASPTSTQRGTADLPALAARSLTVSCRHLQAVTVRKAEGRMHAEWAYRSPSTPDTPPASWFGFGRWTSSGCCTATPTAMPMILHLYAAGLSTGMDRHGCKITHHQPIRPLSSHMQG